MALDIVYKLRGFFFFFTVTVSVKRKSRFRDEFNEISHSLISNPGLSTG